MSNTYAILRFCAAALSVVLLLTYSSFKGLYDISDDVVIKTKAPVIFDSLVLTDTQNEKATTAQNSSKTTSSNETNVVAAAATGTVMGKVVEKFISPYTANTHYDNVYLKNNTNLNINLQDFVNSNLNLNIKKNDKPQVLILHTHATESYLLHNEDYYTNEDLSRTTNNKYNMVALGKIISDRLNAEGIVTLHDTTQHDYPSYNESYSRAANTICNYLKKYPSIKVVIDLHRDALAVNDTDKVKVTTEINGKRAAQIMLVMGSQSGNVTNFPNWQENLKLAVKMQQTVENMYPSLARAILFMPKNYNESLSNGSVLIEIGTDGNTFEEAKYSAELLSNCLAELLGTL